VFLLLHYLIHSLQPILVSLCFLIAWTLVFGSLWMIGLTMREGIVAVKRMHQIPCVHCEFFTGDYRLKCPVQPLSALTEEAIHCSDYTPQDKDSKFLSAN